MARPNARPAPPARARDTAAAPAVTLEPVAAVAAPIPTVEAEPAQYRAHDHPAGGYVVFDNRTGEIITRTMSLEAAEAFASVTEPSENLT